MFFQRLDLLVNVENLIFVLNLYLKDRPSDVNTLGSLRWYLFSKYLMLAFLLKMGTLHF